MGNKARPEEAGRAASGAAGPPRADRAGNAARQTSARRSGCRQRGERRDGPRGGVGGGRGSQAREGGREAAGPGRCARPRPHAGPGAVPLLTRWEAAGSARAVAAAGLRGQEAPPHRGREGQRTGGAGLPTSVRPPPPSPPASSRRKLARSLGRGGTGGRAGWLTAAQRRAESAGAGSAAAPAAAAAAMAEPAGLRPGPGKRRLRGDGGSVPG